MRNLQHILTGLFASFSAFILLTACAQTEQYSPTRVPSPVTSEPAQTQLLGGDRDAHGCIGSAGYSWCEAKNKCLRVWEEECAPSVESATTIETTPSVEPTPTVETTPTVEIIPPGTPIQDIIPPSAKNDTPVTETAPADESALKNLIAASHKKSADDITLKNLQLTDNFARGSVSFSPDGLGPAGLFLAVKQDGNWVIAFEGNGAADCNKMEEFGFPSAMLEGICY